MHSCLKQNNYHIKSITENYSSDFTYFRNSVFEKGFFETNSKAISFKPDVDGYVNVTRELKYPRFPDENSPFKYLSDIIKQTATNKEPREKSTKIKSAKDGFTLEEWNNPSIFSTLDQCKVLIDAIYSTNNDWDNFHDIEKNGKFEKSEESDKSLSLFVERLRIYNYCFVFNNIKASDIFENKKSNYVDLSEKYASNVGFNATVFQNRMFPFLKEPTAGEPLLPKLFDVNAMKPIKFNLTTSIEEHNENFWQSWSKMAKGKGIATTFHDKNGDYFLRGLNVLKYKNNTLPIQIINNENELPDKFLEKMSKHANDTGQQVYLMTITNILDDKVKRYGTNFKHKMYATILNTFEEYIVLDADSISFIPPDEYFNFGEYESSGIYLNRDRELDIRESDTCLKSLRYAEPPLVEVDLIKSSLRYTFTAINDSTATGEAFKAFADDHTANIAESGLVPLNRRKSIAGMLMGTMLRFSARLEFCTYGDKEVYWMGPLYAGIDYEFEPSGAALLGFPKKEFDKDWHYVKTTLCDTHIGHAHEGKLVWTNACMTRSKHAKKDEPNPRLKANGFLIVDKKYSVLHKKKTDFGVMHCGEVVEIGGLEKPHGYVGWMNEEEYQDFDEISLIWNKDIK